MRSANPQVFAFAAVLVAWACAKGDPVAGGQSYVPSGGGVGGTSTRSGTGGTSTQTGTGGSATATGGSSTTTGGSSSTSGGTSGTSGNGTGGSATSTGGSTPGTGGTGTGGTSATAGRSGTGGTNGGGGLSSSGGDGAGGTAPQAGRSSGTGGSGVVIDPTWKAPDMTATATLMVLYQANGVTMPAMSSNIQITLFLKNQTATAYDLSKVTLRYWMSSEPPPDLHMDNASSTLNLSSKLTFVPNMADSYILFTFGKGGTVPAYVDQNSLNSARIDAHVQAASGVNGTFNETNDWSFDATAATTAKPNEKITIYDGDTLIWGCEPTHVCAMPGTTTGEGGAAGASGM
jgi:hypothetical protein